MVEDFNGRRHWSARTLASMAISVVLLSFGARDAPAQSSSHEDFSNVINWLHDGNTKLLRQKYWSDVQGKRTTVTGKVIDVKEAGWLLPMQVEINPKGGRDRVSVICFIKDDDTNSQQLAAKLNVGKSVSCTGKLSNYTLLMNMLSVTVDEARIDAPK